MHRIAAPAGALTACGSSDAPALGPDATDAGGATPLEGGSADGSTSDVTTDDASSARDGAANEGSAGDAGSNTAIAAPPDAWTWVDFPDSKCASGTPTGIGINPHAGATELMIFFEGGGACTTGDSCWGANPGAANVAGYDATTFANANQRRYPILNRADATNPMRAMNMVYVPYCTGDLHAGTAQADLELSSGSTKPTSFWGARDMDLFLMRLVPTFAGATRVRLTGTSAGGFGTFLNFDRVARAFGVRVDILDDSGPPILANHASDNSLTFAAWGFVPPSGCASPCNSLPEVYAFDRASQPRSQFGLLSYTQDTVISVDFGYTADTFAPVVDAFSSSVASDSNAATFLVTNKASHVVESDLTLEPQYMPWITKMVTGDLSWKDVVYAHP